VCFFAPCLLNATSLTAHPLSRCCRFIQSMAAAHLPAVQAVVAQPGVASELFSSASDSADLANSLCIAAACGPGLALEPALQQMLAHALRCCPQVRLGSEVKRSREVVGVLSVASAASRLPCCPFWDHFELCQLAKPCRLSVCVPLPPSNLCTGAAGRRGRCVGAAACFRKLAGPRLCPDWPRRTCHDHLMDAARPSRLPRHGFVVRVS